MAARPADRRAILAATAASALTVAFQLAGKATRDAFYLSTHDIASLPRMVIGAAIGSALLTLAWSHLMAKVGPGRLMPWLFGASALLLLGVWMCVDSHRSAVAVCYFIHFSALGALLISGFWVLVTERFIRAQRGQRSVGSPPVPRSADCWAA